MFILNADSPPTATVRLIPPKGLRKHRVIVKQDEDARFRADPIRSLKKLGIHVDSPDGNLPIHELKGLGEPRSPIAAQGDVVDATCYDIYCCPPVATCFPCKVIEEFTANIPIWD